MISGYGVSFVGLIVPQIWRLGFGEGIEAAFHPVPIVVVKAWPAVLTGIAFLCIVDVLLKLRHTVVLTAISLLLTWAWFFLVSLEVFDGPSSMHKQGASFEIGLFLSEFGGFYPASLALIFAYGLHPFIYETAQQGNEPDAYGAGYP